MNCCPHIFRYRRVELHSFFRDGVDERKTGGMKRLAVNEKRVFSAVQGITKNRVSDVGHVHSDLVRPAGFKEQGNKGMALEVLHHFIMSNRRGAV